MRWKLNSKYLFAMSNRTLILGLLLLISIFILEVTFHFHLLGTIGYLLVVLAMLPFHKNKSIITLGALATAYIILGYLLPILDFKYNTNEAINRALGIVAIWMAIYFTLRQRKSVEKEEKQKEQLAAIFMYASEGMLIIDSTGNIVMVNPCAERMFGYATGQLLGEKIEKLIPQHLHNQHIHHRNQFIETPHRRPMSFNNELTARHNDGHEFPVGISLSHYRAKEGIFVIAFILDLSEQKKQGEKLRMEQHLRRTYFELAPVLFVALDKVGRVTMINDYGSQLLGYAKEEIIGKNWFENFIPSEVKNEVTSCFHGLLTGDGNSTNENTILNSQGEERHIHWRNTLLKTDPQPMILCAGLDITDRKRQEEIIEEDHNHIRRINEKLEAKVKQRTAELESLLINLQQTNHQLQKEIEERKIAEQELVKSQRLHAAIAHHFPQGIIGVLNKEMKYIFADGQELDILGYPKNVNKDKQPTKVIHPALSPEITKSLKKVFEGETISYNVELGHGTYNVSSTPLPDLKNEIREALVVIKNITEQKELERSLIKTIEREQELNTMKSQLITMASHEFRTPLTTILSSVFLLDRYSGADLEREKGTHLNKIKRAIATLNDLLGEFISLGKLDEGKVKIVYNEVDVKSFLEELVNDMEPLRKSNQPITYHYLGEEREVVIDKKLLQGIVLNLIGNAIKYSFNNAPIIVTASVQEKNIILQVIDHGIGIPKEEQHHIFERFYRANNAANIEGSGLGLNIVQKYVHLLNGTIEFESEVNKGTTFTVTLPVTIWSKELENQII
jgi:PAS domain S-box-containing protein